MKEFKLNEFITLKLEEEQTNIYFKNNKEPFIQCKYILLNKNLEELKNIFEDIKSVDELKEKYNQELENIEPKLLNIPPEAIFWAHCSVRHESCMVERGNLRNTKMVSLLTNKPSRNRPRDGRVWLLRHASLEMRLCEALRTMYRQKRLRSCCGLAKDPMANDCKFAINPVRAQGRNVVKRLSKDMLTEGDA